MSEGDSRARNAVITWLTPSKKKNFETTKVLTSITVLPAITARSVMMLKTRMMLRMTYPGPARGSRELLERLKMPIMVVILVKLVVVEEKRKAWVLDARKEMDDAAQQARQGHGAINDAGGEIVVK